MAERNNSLTTGSTLGSSVSGDNVQHSSSDINDKKKKQDDDDDQEEHEECGEGLKDQEQQKEIGQIDQAVLAATTGDDGRYDRFSSRRKAVVVAILAYTSILGPFTTTSFLPVIPDIVHAIDTTPTIINITVAMFLALLGIAPLIWAPLSSLFGRKVVYLMSIPLFVLGSLGVGFSHNLAALIVTRALQAIGSSACIPVGAASVGDMYHPTQRGRAMGLLYSTILLGPSIAPLVAGIFGQYVPNEQGWRWLQWLLAIMGAISFTLILTVLPETHPVVNPKGRIGKMNRPPISKALINPVKPVALLLYPNILAISFTSSAVLLSVYVLHVPIPYTIAPRYNLDNKVIVGSLYVVSGVGNIIGSISAGKFADMTTNKWIAKRNGEFLPEDRLRSALIPAFIFLPVSVIGYGCMVQFVKGTVGLVMTLVFYFISGIGTMLVLGVANTYCVDVVPKRSAEVVAVNNCMRYIFSAVASAAVLPLVKAINVAPTNAIAASLSWCGAGCIIFIIHKGKKLRLRMDEKKRAQKELKEQRRREEMELSEISNQ